MPKLIVQNRILPFFTLLALCLTFELAYTALQPLESLSPRILVYSSILLLSQSSIIPAPVPLFMVPKLNIRLGTNFIQ